MATVKQTFDVWTDTPPVSNYPQRKVLVGTNFPIRVLAFDAATEETTFFEFAALNYGSGNLTLKIRWVADTAVSGNVVWGAAIAAITPETDTQDVETKAFATAQTVIDAHLGTTGQREHEATLTISNLDSLANGDSVTLKIYRDADDATNDTMAGDAFLKELILEYSDT